MSIGENPRETLLEAAESLVVQQGVAALTFDKLAAQAGISKGGVLHHFHNKDLLVEAMVQRSVTAWRQELITAIETVAPGPGRTLRGMLSLCLGDKAEQWTEESKRRCGVLTTAIVTDPDKIESLHAFRRELRTWIQNDGILPGYSDAVALAIDGIWLGWSYGIQQVGTERVQSLRRCLEHVLKLGMMDNQSDTDSHQGKPKHDEAAQ